MKNYYNEVEQAIRRNEAEIKHLKEELKGLRSVEKDTPRESYQRQETQIFRHLEAEQSRLKGNKQLLKNYELAQTSLTKLDELRTLRSKERDSQIRREIDEEITAREKELESSMGALTDELRQEIRENYLNEATPQVTNEEQMSQSTQVTGSDASTKKASAPQSMDVKENDLASQEKTITNESITTQTEDIQSDEASSSDKKKVREDKNIGEKTATTIEENLEMKRNKMANQYKQAEAKYQDAIKKMQDIFQEENEKSEEHGPFAKETDLDRFQEEYMAKKQKQNEIIEEAKKKRDMAKASLNMLNAQMESTTPILALPPHKEILALPPHQEPYALQPHNPTPMPEPRPTPTPTPDPNPDPKPDPTPTPDLTPTSEQKPTRGLLTILDELTYGLILEKKDGKRYKASNIKVAKGFKEELNSGNYLYNLVHIVPSIIKLPFQLLRKVSGNIMYSENAKRNAAALKNRLNNLSEEDLMTIYKEYRGNRVIQERFPTIMNTLIDERIQRFALEKVTQINKELEGRYKNSFGVIKQIEAIDKALETPNRPAKDKEALRNYRKALLKGQTENISAIRKGYVDANEWISGGAHGFSEDMKAATTKLSCVGKRFAKDHDLDSKLLHEQAYLEQQEKEALARGDDEAALRAFVAAETLVSDNTKISNSIYGKRSSGKKYYSPLAEQLDYRDDPFVRDLFTTIAVTSSAISAVNTIRTQLNQQTDVDLINEQIAANNQKMQDVNTYGSEIAGTKDEMMEGISAQNVHDTVAATGEIERGALDINNWQRGTRAYSAADNTGHNFYDNLTTTTQSELNDIATQYASGAITQQQALDLMIDVSKQTQSTLQNVTTECLDILKTYRVTHPQFKLDGYESALTYVTEHPDALVDMYQAMADAANKGDILSSMQFEQIAPLQSLPNDMFTTIFNVAASTALATSVANSMTEGTKKRTYGNEVTNMVDEYSSSKETTAENNKATNK